MKVFSRVIGGKKFVGNLGLYILYNAGHFAPQDNREGALIMLKEFLNYTK
jgi:carboxypeptidase C (cathepsin A)